MNNYFIFLRLILSSPNDDIKKLDTATKLFLDEIALKVSDGIEMTVGDALSLTHLGATATLHRKITCLLNLNLISLDHKGTDRRTKYLKLTSTSLKYYEDLSNLISEKIYIKDSATTRDKSTTN